MFFEEEKKELIFINAYELINDRYTDLEKIIFGIKAMLILAEMDFEPGKVYISLN